jgi:hypothetical protein
MPILYLLTCSGRVWYPSRYCESVVAKNRVLEGPTEGKAPVSDDPQSYEWHQSFILPFITNYDFPHPSKYRHRRDIFLWYKGNVGQSPCKIAYIQNSKHPKLCDMPFREPWSVQDLYVVNRQPSDLDGGLRDGSPENPPTETRVHSPSVAHPNHPGEDPRNGRTPAVHPNYAGDNPRNCSGPNAPSTDPEDNCSNRCSLPAETVKRTRQMPATNNNATAPRSSSSPSLEGIFQTFRVYRPTEARNEARETATCRAMLDACAFGPNNNSVSAYFLQEFGIILGKGQVIMLRIVATEGGSVQKDLEYYVQFTVENRANAPLILGHNWINDRWNNCTFYTLKDGSKNQGKYWSTVAVTSAGRSCLVSIY